MDRIELLLLAICGLLFLNLVANWITCRAMRRQAWAVKRLDKILGLQSPYAIREAWFEEARKDKT